MKAHCLIVPGLLLFPALLTAEEGWTFQASVGLVANLETSLTIRQDGFEEIEIDDADYETRPFEGPLYYALRAGRWRGRTGWELELIHHKLFLQNHPPEVQRFDVSHGYNFVTVNRGWDLRRFLVRSGAGVVIAHPENEVRDLVLAGEETNLPGGYHLAGPAVQVGVEKRFVLGESWFFGLEGKVSAAWAEVPVTGGEAEVPNVAAHVLLGAGWRWR
ncbi:MAG TPA: hypothetical protein VE685_04035 [Thermoanaerobaculia bacterium]|nr:hypothetical protein [Thermoanaerobaculia bacterium]